MELLRTRLIECGWREDLKTYAKGEHRLSATRAATATASTAAAVSLRLTAFRRAVCCSELIKGKGLQKLTVDQLVSEVTPRARATVPEGVKAELIHALKLFLNQQIG